MQRHRPISFAETFGMHFQHFRLAAIRMPALAIAVWSLWAFSAAAEPYRLVAQDRIALRVVEWRSGEGEFKDWSVLNGTFMVNSEGAVSIPLVGDIDAAGLTTKELSERLSTRLRENVGMGNGLFASVEIAQYGPIYVVGAVDKPGQYPFSSDLTVMKAVSLAGGLRKEVESARSRVERDRIQAAGLFGAAKLDYYGLLMREARLRAEKEGRDTFDIPASVAKFSGAAKLHAEELSLMQLRQVELNSKIAAAKGLGELYAHEIETLGNKITAQQRQIAVVKKELDTVNSLFDKGLVQSSRRFSLDRDETDAENKLLDLDFQLLRARQSLEENKRDSEEIVNSMNSKIQDELNEVVREISKTDLQAHTARLMIDEADGEIRDLLLEEDLESRRTVTYYITRRGADGSNTRIEVAGDAPVEPRDLVEIEIDKPGELKAGSPGASPDGEVVGSTN